MKKTEAIKIFLEKNTWKDLAELYSHDMECQVNVSKGNGERVEGEYMGKKYFAFTDGFETWKSFRIPFNAFSNPEYTDKDLVWDFPKHVEAIGMTGWDWKNQVSRFVSFDFDAISGHSENHTNKLSAQELIEVEEKTVALPYTTVRKSTSGSGLHIYIFFKEPPHTSDHNEHAALARAVLTQMGLELGFDFHAKVDVCGGVLWQYHTKMKDTNGEGLKLIKVGRHLEKVPKNWEDHLSVVNSRKSRATSILFDGDQQRSFEHMSEQRPDIKLDDVHRKLIKYLEENCDYESYYQAEMSCLVTHTLALKDAHKALNFVGVYDSYSSGSTSKNCFAFPCPKGGWVVYRFGRGVNESPNWTEDHAGWTRCYFNMLPTIRDACFFTEGQEAKNSFVFRKASQAVSALKYMGVNVDEIPPLAGELTASISETPDRKVVMQIDKASLPTTSNLRIDDWIDEGKSWVKYFEVPQIDNSILFTDKYDDILRLVITEEKNELGWAYCPPGKTEWLFYSKDTAKQALINRGFVSNEVTDILGACANNPWIFVHEPFIEEYPGNRRWNMKAPQLAFPVNNNETLYHPTWNKIFDHVGQGLTPAVRKDPWCKENNVLTGGEYLKLWAAWMFQQPDQRIPYLFLYSPQQHTGKSTIHEALSLLFKGGAVKADMALQGQFNGELASSVLCSIEELNLAQFTSAYNKVKEYTTAQYLSIRDLYKPQTQVKNFTHWIQCANSLNYLPIEPSDTRVVVILVKTIKDLMTTQEMRRRLMKEASDFLTFLMRIELPPQPLGRMALPVLSTIEKKRAERNRSTALEAFLSEQCYYVPGVALSVKDFYDTFMEYLDPEERSSWSRQRINKEMPEENFPRGRYDKDRTFHYGNLSFNPMKSRLEPLVSVDNKLVKESEAYK